MTQIPSYRHDLGKGLYLDAFSLDPKVNTTELAAKVQSLDGRGRLDVQNLASVIDNIGYFQSLSEFGVEPVDKDYEVPGRLKPYRAALAQRLDSGRQFNGPIAIMQGPLQRPIRLFREGRYYDYQATALNNIPGELLPQLLDSDAENLFIGRFPLAPTIEKFRARYDPRLEDRFVAKTMEEFLKTNGFSPDTISRFRGKKVGELLMDHYEEFSRAFDIEVREIQELQRAAYPRDKTVKQLLADSGLGIGDAARYLAFAFIIMPENGNQVSFVYRSPNVGIAKDCMSISGSTPPFTPEIFKPGFNLGFYEQSHLVSQMGHEYGFKEGEYEINGIYALDDKDTIPHLAMKIKTPQSAEYIAQRIFGNERAISEHPILFSLNPQALGPVIERFPMWPSSAYVFHLLDRDSRSN